MTEHEYSIATDLSRLRVVNITVELNPCIPPGELAQVNRTVSQWMDNTWKAIKTEKAHS